MKKLICLMLVFILLLCGCSRWSVEIVDPTKPVESEAEIIVFEEENTDDSQDNTEIPEEEKEPLITSYNKMKICEGEENSEEDFLNLRDDEINRIAEILQQENWTEVPEGYEGKGGMLSPTNMLESPGKNGTLYVSPVDGKTLIVIKWGAGQKYQKKYFAPEEVAFEIEDFRKELAEKAFSAEKEPEAENYCKILLYSEDGNYIYHDFSDEELAEWLSIIKPENWIEYTSELMGGINSQIQLQSEFGTAMYLGFYPDNEVALLKYGKNDNLSKVYILPEGTIAAAEEFEKRIIRENPDVLTYPECNYDISAESLINRESDDYILWLDELMLCCPRGEEDWRDYEGFESSEELDSKKLFNIFMYIFDYCAAEHYDDLSRFEWYDYGYDKYHIPMTDIYTILRKYLVVNGLNMEETSVNYEFDEEKNEIIIPGGYGVTYYRGEKRNIVSVTDNGDGTITAVIESHVYYMDDKDNMILSEKPEIRRTMVLRPGYFRCVVESLKIENIGD